MAQLRRQSLVKFDAPLCETIVDTPKPQGKEVLVRVDRCGLCHSDLHIQDGYADLGGGRRLDTTRGMVLPFTMGHEIAGIVDEVGADADKSLIGTRKAVERLAVMSATLAKTSGISAPPTIAMHSRPDVAGAGAVERSSVSVKITGNMIELNRPIEIAITAAG